MRLQSGKIVAVLSDARSGSTLLDQLLGAHSEVLSLGEVHHLVAYARKDRSLYNPVHPLVCSCGEAIDMCRFWQQVELQLGRPLESLRLGNRIGGWGSGETVAKKHLLRLVRRLLREKADLFRNPIIAHFLNVSRIAADSFDLFNAILRIYPDLRYLVDSSKSPFRFRALYDAQPGRVLALILVRDYRGTIYSKMKRGKGLKESARVWVRRMSQIKELTRDIPEKQLILVRYEDLCINPRSELTRICHFLNLTFSEDMLSRPTESIHHLGGSPSKFDPTKRKIQLDDSYLDAFGDDELALMRQIVGDSAIEWGYQ